MKKIIVTLSALVSFTAAVFAQDDVYPAAKQNKKTAIVGATVHVGNGQVIENGTVVFDNGKIVYAGDAAAAPKAENTIDAKGKQVYPGYYQHPKVKWYFTCTHHSWRPTYCWSIIGGAIRCMEL